MDILSKFTLPGILFLATLAFGFWLNSAGKPYNGILFNIHKLVALSAVIFTVFQVSKTIQHADSLALIGTLLVVGALCIVALFASGALMSMGKLNYTLTLTIHRISPVALVIMAALVAYLLGKKP